MRMLGFEELRTAKGLTYSRVHLYRLIREGKFPRAVQLSPSRVAWVEAEVDAWLESRIAARDAETEAA